MAKLYSSFKIICPKGIPCQSPATIENNKNPRFKEKRRHLQKRRFSLLAKVLLLLK